MTAPTYAQLTTLTSGGPGFSAESLQERILTCLAALASGQNPDGTTNAGFPNVAPANMAPAMPWVIMGQILANAAMANASGTSGSGNAGATTTLFIVERTITLSKMLLGINAVSGNVDVGVYDSTGTNGIAGARLVHSGSVALPAAVNQTSVVSFGSTVTLTPGKYWAACSCDNGTASFKQADSTGFAHVDPNLAAIRADYNLASTSCVLPATLGTGFSEFLRTDGSPFYMVYPAA